MRTSILFYFALSLAALGCGDNDYGPAIHPVSGKVLVDGRPAAKARVTFYALSASAGESPPTMAIAEQDGAFRPSTRSSYDGAPAGSYAVTVVWPRIVIDHGEEIEGPDQLRGKYGDPARSGLKVTIKEGENSLPPFELKTAR